MRKTIYNAIKEALPEAVQHVDLWNNQIGLIEGEQPFNTPAVFIEFDTIAWLPLLRGAREAEVTIHLHIVTDTREGHWEDTIERLTLSEEINQTLHRLTANDGKHVVDSLTLVSSVTDHDFDELANDVDTYKCHITTFSNHTRY